MERKFKVGLISVKQEDSFPPVSLVYIGTYLKKKFPDQIDLKIIDRNYEDVLARIKEENFDLIGISAMTVHYGNAVRLARAVKKDSAVPVVVGGVHISTLPESFEDCFDIGVLGEGEESMSELLQAYLAKGGLRKEDLALIKGLVYLDGAKLVKTAERPLIENLDDLPLSDWSLVDKRYFSESALTTWGKFGVEGSILTSRGCPYKCLFCSTTKFWQKLRFHSPEYVLEQVRDLADNYKVRYIQLWDDLFTINRKRLLRIAQLLKESGLSKRVQFNCQPRPNLIDDELCRILKSMNVKIAIFGFESGSQKVLDFLKRATVSVEDNKRAILCCKKHGIGVQGSVVLASPGETLEDMYKTLDFVNFALKNKVQRLWSFVLTPFPATEIWEIAKKRGKVGGRDFNWDLLSHQNVHRPLLLDEDIALADFQKVFFAIRKRIVCFKWNKVLSFIRDNPLKAFIYFLKSPFVSARLLFTREDT